MKIEKEKSKMYLEELDVFKCISENEISNPSYIFNFKEKMRQELNKSKNINYKIKNNVENKKDK